MLENSNIDALKLPATYDAQDSRGSENHESTPIETLSKNVTQYGDLYALCFIAMKCKKKADSLHSNESLQQARWQRKALQLLRIAYTHMNSNRRPDDIEQTIDELWGALEANKQDRDIFLCAKLDYYLYLVAKNGDTDTELLRLAELIHTTKQQLKTQGIELLQNHATHLTEQQATSLENARKKAGPHQSKNFRSDTKHRPFPLDRETCIWREQEYSVPRRQAAPHDISTPPNNDFYVDMQQNAGIYTTVGVHRQQAAADNEYTEVTNDTNGTDLGAYATVPPRNGGNVLYLTYKKSPVARNLTSSSGRPISALYAKPQKTPAPEREEPAMFGNTVGGELAGILFEKSLRRALEAERRTQQQQAPATPSPSSSPMGSGNQ